MNKPPYGNTIRQLDNTKQFKVSAQDIPNKTVKLNAGVFTSSSGQIIEFQGGVSTPINIDKVPQWVLVSVGISNEISLTYGLTVPAVEKDHIACALLYIRPTHTVITNDMIFDIRSLYNPHHGAIDHNDQLNRDAIDSHPIDAITGLRLELDQKINSIDVTNIVNGKADIDGTDSNIFTLNKNQFGLPASDATIEVNRGSEPNVGFRWSESRKFWEYTNDGYTWYGFDNSAFIGVATDTTHGIVYLSAPADNIDSPIVVGTNDTRLLTFHQKNDIIDHLVDYNDPHKTLIDNAVKFNHLSLDIGTRLLIKDTNGLITETLNIATPITSPAFILGDNNKDILIIGLNAQLLNGHDDQYFAVATHNHDLVYSQLNHNHNAVYSLLGHNHDTLYSAINHNHDLLYSNINHNHDLVYSNINHNHNADYAPLVHNHDLLYSGINHNHDLIYSGINHNHDLVYSGINHTHSQYALITDLTSYALKTDLTPYALSIDLANYSLKTDLVNYSLKTDLATYALKTDLTPYALSLDLANYALKTDLANYPTKTDIASYALKTDLNSYPLKTDLTAYPLKTDLVSYALKTDLVNYALVSDLSEYQLKLDMANYALASEIHNYALLTDLANYPLKTDLTNYVQTADLTTYATKLDLTPYAKSADLTNYALKTDLPTGASGQFTSADGKTITVTNGIITSIV